MSKKSKVVLIPAIVSTTTMLSYWITFVREEQGILGASNDVAGGLVIGMGIGISLVILSTLKKRNSS